MMPQRRKKKKRAPLDARPKKAKNPYRPKSQWQLTDVPEPRRDLRAPRPKKARVPRIKMGKIPLYAKLFVAVSVNPGLFGEIPPRLKSSGPRIAKVARLRMIRLRKEAIREAGYYIKAFLQWAALQDIKIDKGHWHFSPSQQARLAMRDLVKCGLAKK